VFGDALLAIAEVGRRDSIYAIFASGAINTIFSLSTHNGSWRQ
jgi:hypothetical protein